MAILNNNENPAIVSNEKPVEYAAEGLGGVNTQVPKDSLLKDDSGRIILNGKSGRNVPKSGSNGSKKASNGPRIVNTPGRMNDWYQGISRGYGDFGDVESRRLQEEAPAQEAQIPDTLSKKVKGLTDVEKELISQSGNLGSIEAAAANKQGFWNMAIHGVGKMFSMFAGDLGNIGGMVYGALSMDSKQELADKAYKQAIEDGRSEAEAEWDRTSVYLSNISDNAVTNWISETRNNIEEAYLPIYRTEAQQQAAWYSPKNIFSAQFLFNDIIPNFGFMIAGGWATKGIGKAASWAFRVNKARKAYKGALGALTTAKGIEEYQKALKVAMAGETALTGDKLFDEVVRIGKLVNKRSAKAALTAEILGGMSEAGFDAVDNTRAWYELEMENLENTVKERYSDEAIANSIMGQSTPANPTYIKDKDGNNIFTDYGHKLYSNLEAERDRELERGTTRIQTERAKMANTILLGETVLLTLTNRFNFDYMLKGGYRAEKTAFDMANKATRFSRTGNAVKDTKNLVNEISKSLDKELRKTEWVTKGNKWLSPAVEAFEEMGQSYISNAAGLKGASILNRYMGYTVDPEANEKVTNMLTAFAEQFNRSIGDPETYKEGFVAAISSILGLPGMTYVRDANGRIEYTTDKNGRKKPKRKLVMQGEFWDASRETAYIRKNGKDMINRLNEMFSSDEKIAEFQNFVRSVSIQDLKREAIEKGNIFAYKNGETAQFVNMANAFYKTGRMEDLYELVELASNIDESQVDDIKAALRNEETGESIYEGMQPADVVKTIHERGESMKKDIEDYIKIRQGLEEAYGVDVDPDFLDTMTWGMFTFTDAGNRLNELAKTVWEPLNKIVDRINQMRPDQDKIKITDGASAAHAIINFLYDSSMTQKEKDEVQSKLDRFFDDMENGDATMQRDTRRDFLNWLDIQIERRKRATDEATVKQREELEERRADVTRADYTAEQSGWNNDSLGYAGAGQITDVSKALGDIMALASYRNYVLSGINGMSQKPGLFNTTVFYATEKALHYTIERDADHYMNILSDDKQIKTRRDFVHFMEKLRGSLSFDEIDRRIMNGNDTKLKLWWHERELTRMAKDNLKAILHRWAEFQGRDRWTSEAIEHLKDIIDARLSTIKNKDGSTSYGEPATLQELYDAIDDMRQSLVWNNGKEWENILSQKDVDELVKKLDQFKNDANYIQLAHDAGQVMPSIKTKKEDDNKGDGDKGKDDGKGGDGKDGGEPKPNDPDNPGGNPDEGGGGSAQPGSQETVEEMQKAKLGIAEGNSPISMQNIKATQQKGKDLTDKEVAGALKDARELTREMANPDDLAKTLAETANHERGENLQPAAFRPYARRVFAVKQMLEDIANERGLDDNGTRRDRGIVPPDDGSQSPQEKDNIPDDDIPEDIDDKEVDEVKGIIDKLSAIDENGELIMDETHLQMELMNYEMDPEYNSQLSESSRKAVINEIKRLLSVVRGTDDGASGFRPDSTDPKAEARDSEGANDNDIGNEDLAGDGGGVAKDIVKGKHINTEAHEPIEVLPGHTVTDCNIGSLIEGDLVPFDASKYGESLQSLQQRLRDLKVYDFINSGALGVIAQRKGGPNNVKVHFIISSKDNVTIEDQSQEGKNGKVYNILLAIKMNRETRVALKEGGDFEGHGKTNFITVDDEQYQVIGVLSKGARYPEQDSAYNSVYERVVKNSVERQMQEHPDHEYFLGKDGNGVIYTTISAIGSGRMATKKNGEAVGFRPVQEVTNGLVGSHFIGMVVPARDGNGLMMITDDKEVTSELGPIGERVQPVLDNPKTAGTMWLITRDAAGNYSYSYLKIPSLQEYDIEEGLKNHPGNLFLSQLVADVNQLFNSDPKNHFLKRRKALERIMEKIYFPKGFGVKLDARPNSEGKIGVTVTDIYGEESYYTNADEFFAKLSDDGLAFRISKDALMNPKTFEMIKDAGIIQSDYVDAEHHGANFTVKFLPNTGGTYIPKVEDDSDSRERKLGDGPDNKPTSNSDDAAPEGSVNMHDTLVILSRRIGGDVEPILTDIVYADYRIKYDIIATEDDVKRHPELGSAGHFHVVQTKHGSIIIKADVFIHEELYSGGYISEDFSMSDPIKDLRKKHPQLDAIKAVVRERSQDKAAKEAGKATKKGKTKKNTSDPEKAAKNASNGPLNGNGENPSEQAPGGPVSADSLTPEELAALGLDGGPKDIHDSDNGGDGEFRSVGAAEGEFSPTPNQVVIDVANMFEGSGITMSPETINSIAEEFLNSHNLDNYTDEDSYFDDLSSTICKYM